jgi:GDP-4-dehydro-6-deoxy-D-mannose reductase
VNDVALVTGAAGFAGSHLVELLAGTADLVGWSRSAPPSELARLARWQQVDLLDRDRVRALVRELRPKGVYHCAGLPYVAESWSDSAGSLETNAVGTHRLLDALRRADSHCRVLVVGSATVYAPSAAPLTEDAPVAPANPYARSKLAQELIALRAHIEDGLEVIVARPFNHTGARQAPAFVAPSIAKQIALIERGAADPVIKIGNLEAQRDLSDVRDVVRAYAAVMVRGAPGQVYNVASGVARSIRSVLDALVSRARAPVRIDVDPTRLRPQDTPVIVGDAARLKDATGWQPTVPFEQMLDDLLEYWRSTV